MSTADRPADAGQMMVMVNGERQSLEAGATAQDLLVLLGLAGRPLAVEINEHVVPRAELAGRSLAEGDRLEIVTLVGGG